MKTCPLVPIGERIVVERLEPAKQKGRVLIPDAYQEKNLRMKVVAVGPGRLLESGVRAKPEVGNPPRPIRVGDVVLVGKFNTQEEVSIGGRDLTVIHAEGVVGVVK
jgi:chaperonin GroES